MPQFLEEQVDEHLGREDQHAFDQTKLGELPPPLQLIDTTLSISLTVHVAQDLVYPAALLPYPDQKRIARHPVTSTTTVPTMPSRPPRPGTPTAHIAGVGTLMLAGTGDGRVQAPSRTTWHLNARRGPGVPAPTPPGLIPDSSPGPRT